MKNEQYKRYWYFRMRDTFFDDNEIKIMLAEPDTRDYVIILLKMYCLSIKNRGYLILNMNPFEQNGLRELSIILNEPFSNRIKQALEYFTARKLMNVSEMNENGEIVLEMNYIKNDIHSSSANADLLREKRNKELDGNTMGEENGKISEDNSMKTNRKKYKRHGIFNNVFLKESEYKDFVNEYKNALDIIYSLSIYKKGHNKSYDDDYAALLKFAIDDGIPRDNKTNEKVTKSMLANYLQYIKENEDKRLEELLKEMYDLFPELEDLEKTKEKLNEKYIRLILSKEKDAQESIKKRIKKIDEKQEQILIKNGYDKDYLKRQYKCVTCKDTGMRKNGKQCSCINKRIEEAKNWYNGL